MGPCLGPVIADGRLFPLLTAARVGGEQ